MNKLIAAVLLALTVQTAAFAQEGHRRTPEERATNQVTMMKPLNLTAEQEKKIYDFNLQLQAGNDQNAGGDRQAMMGRGREIRAKRDEAYKQIFTADQYKQYEAIQAERRERFKQYRENNNGGEMNERPMDN